MVESVSRGMSHETLPAAYLRPRTTWRIKLPEFIDESQHRFIPQHLPLPTVLVEDILQSQVGVIESDQA